MAAGARARYGQVTLNAALFRMGDAPATLVGPERAGAPCGYAYLTLRDFR